MSDHNRFKFRVWDNNFKKYRNGLAIQNSHICTYDDNACILEQCTGLTDKNGKLVYEGDILKSGIHHYQVAWHEGKFVLNRGCKNYPISGCELMEIIGNIHKNSELPQCEKNL